MEELVGAAAAVADLGEDFGAGLTAASENGGWTLTGRSGPVLGLLAADVLVVAAGVRGLIGAEHVKAGATVIDVGIHRTGSGRVTGDVRMEEIDGIAGRVTPVPGGVGPMTIAMLLTNAFQAAEMARR